MAVCYQNRNIHKGYNKNYYHSNPSFNHKSHKISAFDITDYDKSIKSNNIPIWQCSRCTFTNTKRKSNCSICNLSYKQSKSYTSKKKKSKTKTKKKKPKRKLLNSSNHTSSR
eukprot:77111_1